MLVIGYKVTYIAGKRLEINRLDYTFQGEGWYKNIIKRTRVCQASIPWAVIMKNEQKEYDLLIMEKNNLSLYFWKLE